MEDSLVFNRVIHHGPLVDHLRGDLKFDIEGDTAVWVNIQVYIFELELVVESSLL